MSVTDYKMRRGQDFNKILVGDKVLRDSVTLEDLSQFPSFWGRRKVEREDVERALEAHNIDALRTFSRYFFDTSGIYKRICLYLAYLYKYDTYVTPIFKEALDEKDESDKFRQIVVKGWYNAAQYIDNTHPKRILGDIALSVLVDGCYYAYIIKDETAAYLQKLPIRYCRSRYELNGRKAIEFNVRYFDDCFSDVSYRVRVLKMFSKEIQRAYVLYKEDKLPKDVVTDDSGWVLLDSASTVKFSLANDDAPLLASVMLKLMDLEVAQDLDKKKMLQQILKIVIQKLPLDKDGELLFDIEESQTLHSNAVKMLSNIIGVDVLTTFADIQVADMADNNKATTIDQLSKVERSVYNEAGTGHNLFNSEGSMSLEKSIINDEATMSNLVLQFEDFLQGLLERFSKSSVTYKVQILPTTVYNYKELASQYASLASYGNSKILAPVALGQTQSTVIMTAYFENKMLGLNDVFVPPQTSNTMSSSPAGRKPLAEDKRSEKTQADIDSGRREVVSSSVQTQIS